MSSRFGSTGHTAPPALSSHEAYLGAKRIPCLDGLRALAIAEVIAHHAGLGGLAGRGFLGVSLFFAISGFLITTLLLRERARTGTISRQRFHLRRLLRIWPLYLAVLGLYVAVVNAMEADPVQREAFQLNLPFFATFTTNLFVHLPPHGRLIFYFSWSLAAQEQFYLFWPTVLRACRRWLVPALAIVGFLALQIAVRGAAAPAARPWLGIANEVVTNFEPILLGCAIACALHDARGFALLSRIAARAWSLPLALALVVALQYATAVPRVASDLAVVFLVVAAVLGGAPLATRLLELRALRHVGVVSYCVYLVHMLVMNAVRRAVGDQRRAIVVGLTLVLSVAVASLSQRYFEGPIQSLRERLDGARSARRERLGTSPAVAEE